MYVESLIIQFCLWYLLYKFDTRLYSKGKQRSNKKCSGTQLKLR